MVFLNVLQHDKERMKVRIQRGCIRGQMFLILKDGVVRSILKYGTSVFILERSGGVAVSFLLGQL
jgi:hypothetical protein